MFADLKLAVRGLLRTPGFTFLTVLTLALGIGATTSIFSVVRPVLFQPLPYPNADRVMMVWEGRGTAPRPANFAVYRGLVERSRSFDALAVMKPWQPAATGQDPPERWE